MNITTTYIVNFKRSKSALIKRSYSDKQLVF